MSEGKRKDTTTRYRILGEKSADDSILIHVVDMGCAEGMLDGDYSLSGLNPDESLTGDKRTSERKDKVKLYFMSRKDYGIPSIVEDSSMGYLSFFYNKGYTDCTLSLGLKKAIDISLKPHLLHVKECKSLDRIRDICRSRLKRYNGPYRYFTLLTISVKDSILISTKKRRRGGNLQ